MRMLINDKPSKPDIGKLGAGDIWVNYLNEYYIAIEINNGTFLAQVGGTKCYMDSNNGVKEYWHSYSDMYNSLKNCMEYICYSENATLTISKLWKVGV